MNILVIAFRYQSAGHSESRYAYQLVQQIRKKNNVTVITTSDTFGENEITVRIPRSHKSGKVAKLSYRYFAFVAKAYLEASKILDRIDIVQHISPISFRYPNPLCNLKKPFVWGPVGGSIPYPPGFESISRRESWLGRMRKLDSIRLKLDPLSINTLKRSKRIIVTSNASRDIMPSQYNDKVVVIPEGLERLEIENKESSETYIMSAGRLVPYKAHELLITAFKNIAGNDDWKLKIAGDGPEKRNLEKLISKYRLDGRVELLGKIKREHNLALIAASQFCVFPALNEAFGQTNLEAMSLGKPIIVTDWGGPRDIVDDNVTGYRIAANGVSKYIDELAGKMEDLIRNEGKRINMGEKAMTRFEEKYEIGRVADNFCEVYEEMGSKLGA